jgi:hypothetical protein
MPCGALEVSWAWAVPKCEDDDKMDRSKTGKLDKMHAAKQEKLDKMAAKLAQYGPVFSNWSIELNGPRLLDAVS